VEKLGQPIPLFKATFDTYLRRNGWRVHHYDRHGQPFWQHSWSPTTFGTAEAVTFTPKAQDTVQRPLHHVLVTNQPALV
jgi:hypothetical protein